jgi:hypothetical protein
MATPLTEFLDHTRTSMGTAQADDWSTRLNRAVAVLAALHQLALRSPGAIEGGIPDELDRLTVDVDRIALALAEPLVAVLEPGS